MKEALVPTGASTIKDPTVALSVASAISFPLDKVACQAEPDVVSIALAAQSTILAEKQIAEICRSHCDAVELISSLKVEVATEQNKAKSAIADLAIITTKAEAKEKKAEEECAMAVVEEEKANHVDLLWRAAEETTNVAEEEKAKHVDLLQRSAEERAKVINTALAKAKEEIKKTQSQSPGGEACERTSGFGGV
ncbi:uncharacterized protein LOC114291157 [Camellia sinensis]|uniref:uncharacterized protein LOC114291157 n=1 Tax=Camellia sinensis TaxID=4442 RepID=UPI0010368B34|nr:uncharacterized protein LOC114291157 [Camellia sinensis]